MNTMTTASNVRAATEQAADKVSNKADSALNSAQTVTNQTIESLRDGVHQALNSAPEKAGRVAAKAEAIVHSGVERARELGSTVKQSIKGSTVQACDYIKEQPMKSVLIATAVGAGLAVLLGALSRDRTR